MAGALGACTPADEPSVPPADPGLDVRLAEECLAAELAMLVLLESMQTGAARRLRVLAGMREVHQAHVRLLTEAVPTTSPSSSASPSSPAPFDGNERAADLALAQAEEGLARTLRAAALRAESGPFARVLAGMSASAAQWSAYTRRRL